MIRVSAINLSPKNDACCGEYNNFYFGRAYANAVVNVSASVKNFKADTTNIEAIISSQVYSDNFSINSCFELNICELNDLESVFYSVINSNDKLLSIQVPKLIGADFYGVEYNAILPTLNIPLLITVRNAQIANNLLLNTVSIPKLYSAVLVEIIKNPSLTTIALNSLTGCRNLNLNENDLPDAVIDNLFIQLNANGLTDCNISVSNQVGGGTATAASLAARNNLITNNCTIVL